MDIYGIIGYPIKHSLSPAMHNAAFKALGIAAEYKKFEVRPEGLEDFLLNMQDVKGFNITVPHKVRAREILEKNKSAEGEHYVNLCGAINTVKRDKDKLRYTNTDVLGFLTSLKEDLKFDHTDKDIILLGCGGAGRAVIAALVEGSRHIYAYDESAVAMQSAKKAFVHFKSIEFISKEKISAATRDSQLLVNATPIGMKEEDGLPVDKDVLHKDLFVYDVVYNRETDLVKAARTRAVGGIGMLLYQGAHAFEFWTDKKAPIDTMHKALNRNLS